MTFQPSAASRQTGFLTSLAIDGFPEKAGNNLPVICDEGFNFTRWRLLGDAGPQLPASSALVVLPMAEITTSVGSPE